MEAGADGRPASGSVFFNTADAADAAPCGGAAGAAALWGGSKKSDDDAVGVNVEVNSTTLSVTLAGPAGVWHGLGLNATEMADTPYALVVDGDENGQGNGPARSSVQAGFPGRRRG